jgi:hypothetical protein
MFCNLRISFRNLLFAENAHKTQKSMCFCVFQHTPMEPPWPQSGDPKNQEKRVPGPGRPGQTQGAKEQPKVTPNASQDQKWENAKCWKTKHQSTKNYRKSKKEIS